MKNETLETRYERLAAYFSKDDPTCLLESDWMYLIRGIELEKPATQIEILEDYLNNTDASNERLDIYAKSSLAIAKYEGGDYLSAKAVAKEAYYSCKKLLKKKGSDFDKKQLDTLKHNLSFLEKKIKKNISAK